LNTGVCGALFFNNTELRGVPLLLPLCVTIEVGSNDVKADTWT